MRIGWASRASVERYLACQYYCGHEASERGRPNPHLAVDLD
jgi:hypothetical protein